MVVVRKPLNTMVHTKDFTKVLLAEVRRYYEQPLSEEQAWAICFQCCYKMKWMKAHGLDSALRMRGLNISAQPSTLMICKSPLPQLSDSLSDEVGGKFFFLS
uniref:KIND domain-containing protein n=1 Tax=Podarcis muralis TaxID=64176 RepID=A0A670IGW4_PODMU